MHKQQIKQAVKTFKKQYKYAAYDYKTLCHIADKLGYTVIEFNNIKNDTNVQILLDCLKLSHKISASKGFTYADNNYRLVFIHEDLSIQEKTIVLAHETGHIYLEHMTSIPILGTDVREEYEANEFVHYLLTPSFSTVMTNWIASHKKLLIVSGIIIVLLTAGITAKVIYDKQNEKIQYYLTETGSKYHIKNCVYLKNKENIKTISASELESTKYEPCRTCMPN